MANQVVLEFIGDPTGLKPVADALQSLGALTDAQVKAFTKANQDFAKKQGELAQKQLAAIDSLISKMKQVPQALSGKELADTNKKFEDFGLKLVEIGKGSSKLKEHLGSMIDVLKGVSTGLEVAQKTAKLLGVEYGGLEKAISKVKEVQGLLTSVQELANQVTGQGVTKIGALKLVQAAYSAVVGASTGVMKGFRIALATTGVGLLVVALVSLITHFDKIKGKIVEMFPAIKNFGSAFEEAKNIFYGFTGAVFEGLKRIVKAYVDAYQLIYDIVTFDFDGVKENFNQLVENAKTFGKGVSDAYSNEYAESEKANAKKREDAALEADIKMQKNRLKVLEAGGKETYNLQKEILEKELKLLQSSGDKDAIAEKQADIEALVAGHNKALADKAKERAQREAEENQRMMEEALEIQASLLTAEILTQESKLLVLKEGSAEYLDETEKLYRMRAELEKLSLTNTVKTEQERKAIIDNVHAKLKKDIEELRNIEPIDPLDFAETQARTDISQIKTRLLKADKGSQQELFAKQDLIDAEEYLAEIQARRIQDQDERTAKLAEVEAQYGNKRKELEDEIADKQKANNEKRKKEVEELIQHTKDSIAKIAEAAGDNPIAKSVTDIFNSLASLAEDLINKTKDVEEAVVATFQAVADAGFDIAEERRSQQLEADLEAIDEKREAELESLEQQKEQGIFTEEQVQARKQAIEQKYKQQERLQKLKAFNADKQANIAQAIINGALAVVTTIAKFGPPVPPNFAGIAAIALTAAATAAQVATIAAQKPPAFRRGTKSAPGGWALVGEEGPELVHLPMGTKVITNSETKRFLDGGDIQDVLSKYGLPALERGFVLPVVEDNVGRMLDMREQFKDFDYKKLETILSKNKTAFHIDKNGIFTIVDDQNNLRTYYGTRYSSR